MNRTGSASLLMQTMISFIATSIVCELSRYGVYYSVDKAYLHKSVLIAASATTVNIYSMKGELIVSWGRASRKGEWLTDPAHLPESYKQMSEWNATYFTRKAMTV